MRKTVGAIALCAALLASIVPATASNISGSKCTKKDSTKIAGGVKYLCLAKGKKLSWDKGTPLSSNKGASAGQPSSGALIENNQLASLPIDGKAPLNLDLKGQGQGDGLTFVPFAMPPGKTRAPGSVIYSGNLQPVFYALLGTPVLAPVSGTVFRVTKLYSNDYNISFWVSGQKYIWEVEHVINVKVVEGQKVVAGQEIAQVTNHDEQYTPGIGFVELGVFTSLGGKPLHLCPFINIAPTKKAQITNEISAMVAADTARGYVIPAMEVVGCMNTVPIEG